MIRFSLNLLAAFGVVLTAMLVAPSLAFAWAHAFIVHRSFSLELLGVPSHSLVMWLYYLLFFLAMGVLLHAFIRSPRPLAWGAAVGLGYCAWWLSAGEVHIFNPSFATYASLAGEYVSAVAGCMIGVAVAHKVRRVAPNNLSKPTPLRGAA